MKTIQTAASDYQSGFNDTTKVNQAVVTVPQWRSGLLTSTYEFLWSEAIIQAGLKLEIEILDIIPEVYADLLYYLSKYDVGKNKNILVIDCGGGRTACQGYQIIEDGDRERIIHLSLLAEKEWESIIEMSEFDPKLENTTFVVEKTMFDDMFNEEIVERYHEMLLQWKEKYNFDVIFLAGGTNRIPILQEIVKKEFPNGKIIMDGQVEIITATGAAIHGLQLLNGDCVPLSSFTRFNVNGVGRKNKKSHISAATSEENEIEKTSSKTSSLKVENPKLFIKKIEMVPHNKI
uniref:Actin-like ATPase domain-containing protein n=1 Tax=Panagrolaimus sp. JU765 TaxID=591449 RepID=A0AC34RL32_9BILA